MLPLFTFKLFPLILNLPKYGCVSVKTIKKKYSSTDDRSGRGENTVYMYIIILKYASYQYSGKSNLRLGRLRQQVEKHESFLFVHVLIYKQHPCINKYTAFIVRNIGYNKKHFKKFLRSPRKEAVIQKMITY